MWIFARKGLSNSGIPIILKKNDPTQTESVTNMLPPGLYEQVINTARNRELSEITVISALDYKRFCKQHRGNSSAGSH